MSINIMRGNVAKYAYHCLPQAQYSITIIELIMAHLNEKSYESPQVRTGIADVLSNVIPIAAGECIGMYGTPLF